MSQDIISTNDSSLYDLLAQEHAFDFTDKEPLMLHSPLHDPAVRALRAGRVCELYRINQLNEFLIESPPQRGNTV